MRVLLGMLFVVAASTTTAYGHDFWIEPAHLRLEANRSVLVRLRVGHGEDVKDVQLPQDRVRRFDLVDPSGGVAPLQRLGLRLTRTATTALWSGLARLERSGVYALAYTADPAFIELEPKKFHRYLESEGLDAVIQERRRRGEASAPGRESYARSCKTLVQVGTSTQGFDRTVGVPLELTPIDNPFLASDAKVRFRLTRRGEPLEGAQVDLLRLEGLKTATMARTDSEGRIAIQVPGPGRWLLATTTMERAEPGSKADWVSLWGTLLLESSVLSP